MYISMILLFLTYKILTWPNILTDATNDEDQPLTSLEFSAGTGDYGNNFSQRYSTSRIDFNTIIYCVG